MKRRWRSIGCLGLVGAWLMMTGCAKRTISFEEQAQLTKSVKQQNLDFQAMTEHKLTEVAVAIDQSLAELAAIERTRTPPNKKLVTTDNSATMHKRVTLDWNGPIAPLLQRVAKLISYRLRIIGKTPAVPVLVSVNGRDILVADLLRNADLQCGQRAKIIVYGKQRLIELRYHE